MRLLLVTLIPALLAPLVPDAWASKAHEHGVAQVDVAIDGARLAIALSTPLDNLVGFERAPRNEAERQRVAEAVARLKDGERLFGFDAAAGCKLARSSLDSALLGLGSGAGGPAQGEHADLQASWEFDCIDAARATQVEVGLFAFKALQRIDVQLVLPKGQARRELKRPNARLSLGR